MAENPSKVEKYMVVGLTAVVSLVVGVGTGLLLDFFRSRAPRLVYTISSAEMFPGENQSTGIVLLRIGNSGGREAEDVFCRVSVADATIKQQKTEGVPNVNQLVKATGGAVELNLPFLNPGERLSLHLLLDLHGSQMAQPTVQLRAKGVTGVEESPGQETATSPSEILTLSGTVLAAFLAGLTTLLAVRARTRGVVLWTHDDQREVFAYILGVHGFLQEAQQHRLVGREETYWSIADMLTEIWIAAGDRDQAGKGVRALEDLLDYAHPADSSVNLIRLNIARLALVAGDEAKARSILAGLREKNDAQLKKRLAHDPHLAAFL